MSGQSSSVKYRPDIDGLRALAVLLVIAFHLGLYRLRGGFIGVDVFFVISGFLICSLLYGDLQAGKFSLSGFYERRIRRILPALIVVLAATTVAAAFILLPPRFEDFGQSLAAAALSFSNFFFWLTSGYFDAPAETKPLLHTWSLAVEEQFYLVFPPVLAAFYKLRRPWLIGALAALAAASFVASAIGAFTNETATFYLPLTRAWELLLGALLALGAFPTPKGKWAHVFGLLGLALIVASALVLTAQTPFPGLAALPACLGTAMMVAAGKTGEGISARALSLRPIVVIGLMSYSLYLWHWPLIVLFREETLTQELTHIQQAEIVAACLGLSLLSWLFVERPFRRVQAPRMAIFAGAGASIAALTLAAVLVIGTNGAPQRFPSAVSRLAAFANFDPAVDYRSGSCFLDSKHSFADFRPSVCLRQQAGRENILLVGDSHAAHFYRALVAAHPSANVMQATASGCLPTLTHPAGAARCEQLMSYVYRSYLVSHHVDLVVISADWEAEDVPGVGATLDWLHAQHANVVLLGPSETYDAPLPILLARELEDHDPNLARRHRVAGVGAIDSALAQVAQLHGVRYVSTYAALCPGGRCLEFAGAGIPLQYDSDHLTREGATLLIQRLDREGAFHG